jgi:hypothetical protein
VNLATSGTYAGVRIKSSTATTYNISFLNCIWSNVRNGIVSNSASYGVIVDTCYFVNMYKGIILGESASGPKNYRITNSTFDTIAHRAIDCYSGVIGVNSFGNHYRDVGKNFTSTPVSTIINFVDGSNHSLGDIFDRTDTEIAVYPVFGYTVGSKIAILNSNVGLVVGTATIGTGSVVTLADNQSSEASTGVTLPNPCVVNFSISRGLRRSYGTLHYANNGSGPYWTEESTSSDDYLGVQLSVNSSSVLTYTTSSTGLTATLKYNINSF